MAEMLHSRLRESVVSYWRRLARVPSPERTREDAQLVPAHRTSPPAPDLVYHL
jgi:hypothetical protein